MRKRGINKRFWLKLIDRFMGIHKRSSLSWKAIVQLEGGYGKDKIKSVEEAMLPENEGTWPGIWFQSKQTDLSIYARYDYIYSLLFGRQISGQSISIIAAALEKRAKEEWATPYRVIDWGGSIFTAVDLLDLTPTIGSVVLVNLTTPQYFFSMFAIEELGLGSRIKLVEEESWAIKLPPYLEYEGPIVIVLSEVLEHIRHPIEYLQDLLETLRLHDMYIASSFCTPAYGHYIPIFIGEKECHTARVANKRFIECLKELGYNLTKQEGWNSRVWWVRKEGLT